MVRRIFALVTCSEYYFSGQGSELCKWCRGWYPFRAHVPTSARKCIVFTFIVSSLQRFLVASLHRNDSIITCVGLHWAVEGARPYGMVRYIDCVGEALRLPFFRDEVGFVPYSCCTIWWIHKTGEHSSPLRVVDIMGRRGNPAPTD